MSGWEPQRPPRVFDIASRAVRYGFPGTVVNGNDILAVYEVAREAMERARRGEGLTNLRPSNSHPAVATGTR